MTNDGFTNIYKSLGSEKDITTKDYGHNAKLSNVKWALHQLDWWKSCCKVIGNQSKLEGVK